MAKDIIRLERISDNGKTTIGRLYFNGKFLCHTAEDTRRFYELPKKHPDYQKKIFGETCIAAGFYDLAAYFHGKKFYENYIERFKSIGHKGMIIIENVPQFTAVLMHCGNTKDDTHGCILLGTKLNSNFIAKSTAAYKRVYQIIYPSIAAGNCELHISDVPGVTSGGGGW